MKTFYRTDWISFHPCTRILTTVSRRVNYSWTTFKDDELKERFGMKPVVGFTPVDTLRSRFAKIFFCIPRWCMRPKEETFREIRQCAENKFTYSYIDIPINYTVDFKVRIGKSREF